MGSHHGQQMIPALGVDAHQMAATRERQMAAKLVGAHAANGSARALPNGMVIRSRRHPNGSDTRAANGRVRALPNGMAAGCARIPNAGPIPRPNGSGHREPNGMARERPNGNVHPIPNGRVPNSVRRQDRRGSQIASKRRWTTDPCQPTGRPPADQQGGSQRGRGAASVRGTLGWPARIANAPRGQPPRDTPRAYPADRLARPFPMARPRARDCMPCIQVRSCGPHPRAE